MQLAPSTLAQWVAAVATSLAVIIALFKEAITRRFRRPDLILRIKPADPDCIKTPVHVTSAGNVRWSGQAYFLRVWVENRGKQRAEKVQVFLASVRRRLAGGSFEPVKDFAPMNLRWSHTDFVEPEIYADGISPGMGKHCDLGCISEPSNPTLQRLPDMVEGQVTLDLWLEVFPANQGHRLPPGEYRLEIKTAGSNCMPAIHRISLNLTGRWFADERKMFSDGVGINLD
jgi:hypothetical protein